MADEDNNTSSSSHNSPLLLHSKRKQQQQHQQQQHIKQQQQGAILVKVPHSFAAAPSTAPTPPHRAAASSSCTLRPVKCLDAVVSSKRQQEYDSPAAAAAAASEPLGSGSGSSDVVASAGSLVRERALLGQADAELEGVTPCANGFLPRKRKFEDILQDSARIVSDGKKTLRIKDLVAGPGSAIFDGRGRIVHSAKNTEDKMPNCNESEVEAEEALSGGLPHSGIVSSVPPSEVLEAILDNLQKKDTYGVFSEPVDATEVPDYYNVIKEPMDFGTIRDKLSKGTYVSLELFKKDVFLICSNAMHYNGPKTIYFKQARSIQNAARKTINVIERQMSGLDDYSKIAKKLKATGAKQSWKSSTCKNSFQLKNIDNKLRSTPVLGTGSFPKNNGDKKAVSNRVGNVWQEDTGAEDTYTTQFQSGDTERSFLEYGNLGASLKGKEGRRLPAVFENRRSSYQTLACPASTSADFQQLLPTGCQQKHAYAQSLANFGADFKSEAWKYVAKRIQKVLAPHVPFGPGWVSENNVTAGETLLEEVEPSKCEMKEIGRSITGVSDQSGIGNMIHVSSVPHSAGAARDSEHIILPTSRKSAHFVTSVGRETSQASSLITCTDTQSQSTGSNIKALSKGSSQTVEQSACKASLDTSNLFPSRPIESYQEADFGAIGDRQQMARICTAERSFEESNRKEVNEMNQSFRVSDNAISGSATVAKGAIAIQARQPVAQAIPVCNHGIGDAALSRGSFGVEQWFASAQRPNSVLDYPAFAVIPSCGESVGNEAQRVLNWGQVQAQRRDKNINSEAHEQRLSDMGQSPQKFLWNMESCTPSRNDLYASPEQAHFQSEPLPLPDYVSVSEPRHLGSLVSSSELLTENPQLQSVSHSSLSYPWQSFPPQKSLGQFATTSFIASNNLNPYYQFPVTPQALKGMRSSQQPNLALQL